MSVSSEIFQEIIGEVVREKENEVENLSKQEVEKEVRKYVGFDQQQRFDGNFISARDNREFIGSEDEYGNVIEPGEGGEHQGEIIDVWFNHNLNKERPLVNLEDLTKNEVSKVINAQEVSISKSDIEKAFEKTEASLNSDNYEYRYSPWHFIDIDGTKKPINDVFWNIEAVQNVANSKDDIHSIQEVFADLGYELYDRKEHAEEILRDTFEEILEDYPKRQGTASKDKRLYQLLVNKAPNFVKHIAGKNFDKKNFNFKGTAGQGNWPNIPWVAILHPDETNTTQKGVYIVYLIDPVNQTIYATLNQGTTEVTKDHKKSKAREILENRAKEIREKVDLKGFSTEKPALSDNDKLYEEGTIYQREYQLEDLPDPKQIGKDFVELAEAYLDYLETKEDLEYPILEEKNTDKKIQDFESGNLPENSDSKNYFWVNAKPSRWKVERIKDGGNVFYTAYNHKGNKRKNHRAFKKATEGDKVIFYESQPSQKVVATGEIVEGLHEEERDGFDRPVEGISITYGNELEPITWQDLKSNARLKNILPNNNLQGSLFEITEEVYTKIREFSDKNTENKQKLEKLLDNLDFEIELTDSLHFENKDKLEAEINASLNSGKNIIFTGPPGTGKTKLAKDIARQVSQEKQEVEDTVFTTATADWNAFDTIGGYMPSNGDNLVFKPGQFLKCFREESGEITNKWLVIDEINRSDIDKAFGQLFSVLSGDSVELPYERNENIRIESLSDPKDLDLEEIAENKDIYPVTDSWRLIATMNTLDKASLYEMSYAFMRRFNFIHIGIPDLADNGEIDPSLVDDYTDKWDLEVSEQDKKNVAVLWHKVNKYREIGPSIIEDILQYMQNYDENKALESATVSLIYPQMEGMRPQKQREFIESLSKTEDLKDDESFSLDLNTESLKQKAEDMFNISFEQDD